MTQNLSDLPQPVQIPVDTHPYVNTNMAYKRNSVAGMPPPPRAAPTPDASASSSYTKQQKPIDDAVHTAFDGAHVSGIDQEDLITRITQQVLKQLQTNPGPLPQPYPPPPAAPFSSEPSSAASAPGAPLRQLYTPPSPHRAPELNTSILDSQRASPDRKFSPERSPRTTEPERPATKSTYRDTDVRPASTSESPQSEETTLEKIWGKLFDESGMPTIKLSQLLRGTATHMIERYEPKNSLVVTPSKMQKFYKDHPIPDEPYPWDEIFNDYESRISRMYRELECEHHLVQEPGVLDVKPDIPGLTPQGFQQWATLLILAHPNQAWERFQSVVQDLPISNPDDRKERLPKKLPRTLFPSTDDQHIRSRLVRAIEAHANVSIDHPDSATTPRNQPPNPMPPPAQRPPSPPRSEASMASETPSMSSSIERERQPYSASVPRGCAIDDTNPQSSGIPSKPTERVRKPSVTPANTGRGANAEDLPPLSQTSSVPLASKSTTSVPPPPASIHRANSTASSRPMSIPPPPSIREREYPPSTYSPNPMIRRGSVTRRRNYSPPPASGFRNSEGDVAGSLPISSFESRNAPPPLDAYDDVRHHLRDSREPESRRLDHSRGLSPGRRFDRAATADSEFRRPSSFVAADDYYQRPRRDTNGPRTAW